MQMEASNTVDGLVNRDTAARRAVRSCRFQRSAGRRVTVLFPGSRGASLLEQKAQQVTENAGGQLHRAMAQMGRILRNEIGHVRGAQPCQIDLSGGKTIMEETPGSHQILIGAGSHQTPFLQQERFIVPADPSDVATPCGRRWRGNGVGLPQMPQQKDHGCLVAGTGASTAR